ncbi:acyltransferase [Cyclobacterium plantarum]|uniref:acyltransferase n=1 Tax=Cyclobacterium plantarum TaxID=2716263 RepID=UPI003F6EF965
MKILKFVLFRYFFVIVIHFREKLDRLMGKTILFNLENTGINCHIEGYGRIYEKEKLYIGNHVSIGRNFFIRCRSNISIGDYTHISRNVTIHSANHNIHGDLLPYDHTLLSKPIVIGSYVWVGMNVSILSGVTIGDGAVIGMGSVVSKDVDPGEIVVGQGQRTVSTRNLEHTKYLVSNNKFLKISNE